MNWTSTAISKLFRINDRYKSRQTLLNAESRKEIPEARREKRGNTEVRVWSTNQLPEIGKKFGFLTPPKEQLIISTYTSKGGILKTSISHNISRVFALNNIKTLVIGLDIQLSITESLQPSQTIDSLDDYTSDNSFGLYHYLKNEIPLDKVIKKTDIPTLDYIPETPELNALEKLLRHTTRKEYFLLDNLIPHLNTYDVIIFDNSPSWNCLIENALTASNHIISPIGCEIGSYRALMQHLEFIDSFKKAMKLNWQSKLLIPTLLEKTKISQQIYGSYLNEYGDLVVPTPIRRSVKGHEASVLGISVIEHDSSSPLASDYYDMITSLWSNMTKLELQDVSGGN
jgi:chromosome partitioning protein